VATLQRFLINSYYDQCDEKRPSCFNCTRLGETCEYKTILARATPRLKPTISSARDGLNLQDLELFYVWSTSTCASLSLSPVVRDFWRITVPRLALESEYLMREIFALSALHLAHHRPEQRGHYMSIALSHHQVASKEAIKLLEDVTEESAAGLFIFSAFTILIG
jgi:hypothetical protein